MRVDFGICSVIIFSYNFKFLFIATYNIHTLHSGIYISCKHFHQSQVYKLWEVDCLQNQWERPGPVSGYVWCRWLPPPPVLRTSVSCSVLGCRLQCYSVIALLSSLQYLWDKIDQHSVLTLSSIFIDNSEHCYCYLIRHHP